MEKIYMIRHAYDTDGGFGDAIHVEDVVGFVRCTEEEIKAFEEEFDKPEVYDEPYASLECHMLLVEEVELSTINELRKDPYGDGGVYANYIKRYKERTK